MITLVTHSPEETWELARRLAPLLSEGDVIDLTGDLGAGKTVFTKGLAEGLGVSGPVTSPTFTIIKEYYQGRLPLYHFDVYRLADPDELEELGVDEYFFGEGVSVVEWGDKVEALMPDVHLVVRIIRLLDESVRRLEIIPRGDAWEQKVKAWLSGA